MKNLILFFALIAIGISATAQQKDKKAAKTDVKQAPAQETAPAEKQAPAERVTPTDKQDVQVEKKEMPPQREFVKMADGKVLHVIGMNETEIKEEITIGETKVKPDGTVTMKDGTIQKMKDGNIVNINGKLLDIGAFREKSAQPMTPAQPASPKQPASPQ